MTNRHPELEAWQYPLVGDKDVTMIEPVVIDVATAQGDAVEDCRRWSIAAWSATT